MRYALQLVTAPVEQPVDIDQAKVFLKVDPAQTVDDPLIERLIVATVEQMEAEYNEAFVSQTWKIFYDRFPVCYRSNSGFTGGIELPKTPLASVTHVKYYDDDDVQQTLTVGVDYTVDAIRRPGRIVPFYGTYWQSVRYKPNAVEIQFVCGYGPASAVPAEIKRELQVRLTHAYENRGLDALPANNIIGRWAERRINV